MRAVANVPAHRATHAVKFNLTAPCGDCPFRNDGKGIKLNNERAQEILEAITDQQKTFSCHKTVDYDAMDEDEEYDGDYHVPGYDEEHCGGALIFLEHIERPNQMMRIMERLRFYDRTKLHMDSAVFDDEDDFIDHHQE